MNHQPRQVRIGTTTYPLPAPDDYAGQIALGLRLLAAISEGYACAGFTGETAEIVLAPPDTEAVKRLERSLLDSEMRRRLRL